MKATLKPRRCDPFDGLKRLCLAMAYDNGAINRGETAGEMVRKLRDWPTAWSPLGKSVGAWALRQSGTMVAFAVSGDEDESREALADAPEGADGLLESMFNEVVCAH